MFLPLGYRENYLTQYADVITIIYLLTLGGVAVLLGALSSKNTYALIGSSREMITMIMVEPVLAMTLHPGRRQGKEPRDPCLGIAALPAAGYGASVIIMLVVYLMALQAFVGRQPFDIAEAEVEILEGPFIEYSGPNLALFKYYMLLKQMFYATLFVIVFIPAIQDRVLWRGCSDSAGICFAGLCPDRGAGFDPPAAPDRPGAEVLRGADRRVPGCGGIVRIRDIILI